MTGANDPLALARRLYRERRLRNAAFADPALFGEPAWDLLLDLYVASHGTKSVPVISACAAAAVPTTTALRWLGHLQAAGLVVRMADPVDKRRTLVRLTSKAVGLMDSFFAQLPRAR